MSPKAKITKKDRRNGTVVVPENPLASANEAQIEALLGVVNEADELDLDTPQGDAEERKSFRLQRINSLENATQRNGVLQGKYFFEQFEEYGKEITEVKKLEKAFSNFCSLCDERPAIARQKMSRYLFVKSMPCGHLRNSVNYLRGVNIDKLKGLTPQEISLVSRKLAIRLEAIQDGATKKRIENEINELAKEEMKKRDPAPLPGFLRTSTPPAQQSKGGHKPKSQTPPTTSETSDNPENVSVPSHDVRDIPAIKGFRYPSPDDLLKMTLEQRTDAVRSMFQATKALTCLISADPDEFVNAESLTEIDTLVSDVRREMKSLRSRLSYRTAKIESALERVA